MRWFTRVLVVVVSVALIAAAGMFVRRALGWRSDREAFAARLDSLAVRLDSAVVQDDRRKVEIAVVKAREEKARLARDSARRAADERERSARRRLADLEARLEVEAPDTCAPFIAEVVAEADSALAAAASWRRAYGTAVEEMRLKDERIVLLTQRSDSLRAVLDTTRVVISTRPPSRLIPEWIYAGPGIDALSGRGGIDVGVNVLPALDHVVGAIVHLFRRE